MFIGLFAAQPTPHPFRKLCGLTSTGIRRMVYLRTRFLSRGERQGGRTGAERLPSVTSYATLVVARRQMQNMIEFRWRWSCAGGRGLDWSERFPGRRGSHGRFGIFRLCRGRRNRSFAALFLPAGDPGLRSQIVRFKGPAAAHHHIQHQPFFSAF